MTPFLRPSASRLLALTSCVSTSLFANAAHCAHNETVWLLPKGRNADEEVAEAKRSWHSVFHVEQSITHPDSSIVIARYVRRRR